MPDPIDIAVDLGALPPPLPEIQFLRQFVATVRPPPPQIIGGILHQGCKMVLGGTSKSNKSWCLHDLALSVASGQPWWGRPCSRMPVLYLNFELHDWALAQRLEALCASRPECHLLADTLAVWNLRGRNADLTVLRPKLEEQLARHEFGLIILDPAYKVLGNRDENANGEIADLMNEFEALAQQTRAAVVDYGYHHYTVALLGCTDGDGNLFVVDEHAARNWVPERHAEAIKVMLQRHRVAVTPRWQYDTALKRFVAGTDLFARQSTGLTIAQQYADLGLKLRPAQTDRISGWAEILKQLGDPEAGIRPRLFFHRRCTRLVDGLPALQHDPSRPEDVLKVDPDDDGIGGDAAADALRYLLAGKPRQILIRNLTGL